MHPPGSFETEAAVHGDTILETHTVSAKLFLNVAGFQSRLEVGGTMLLSWVGLMQQLEYMGDPYMMPPGIQRILIHAAISFPAGCPLFGALAPSLSRVPLS